jgi:hypothetical protein
MRSPPIFKSKSSLKHPHPRGGAELGVRVLGALNDFKNFVFPPRTHPLIELKQKKTKKKRKKTKKKMGKKNEKK